MAAPPAAAGGSSFGVSGLTREAAATGPASVTISYTPVTSTTTALSSSANPSVTGQQVTYTATVSPAPDGGTVAFTEGGAVIGDCGAQPVDTGTGTATCQVTYTSPGSHSITAFYGGDAAFGASSDTLTQIVSPAAQTITFTFASLAPAVTGGSYTPAATGGGSGNPVTFSIDSSSASGACAISCECQA